MTQLMNIRLSLKLRLDCPRAFVNLGLVYYAQSKFDDSAQALSTAARLRPGMRGEPMAGDR